MIDERICEMFREIGRDLYVADMVSSHGGNLSIRLGDRVVIKRRGAMLGRLKPHDLIETGLEKKRQRRRARLDRTPRTSHDLHDDTRARHRALPSARGDCVFAVAR